MKKLFYLFTFAVLLVSTSCSDDDDIYTPTLPGVTIINLSENASVAQEDTIYLKANIQSEQRSKFIWTVNNTKSANITYTDSVFKFVQREIGNYRVTLTCINPDGETSVNINLSVYGKFKYGTFVLNEGNMTTENGSLTFISPKGVITDSAYFKVNGTELGSVCQDLFIADNKIYIVAQNSQKLVVANAETLVKEAVYNDELSTLSWPTHVAVLDDEAFIRDNRGVYSFNTSTKELKLLKGTSGALKNRMAKVGNKVFVPANKSVLVLEAGKDSISHKIEFDANVSGVIKTSDNNIYVSTTGTPHKITKINAQNYSVIKENEITEGKVGAGWGATPGISAKGDTIYYSNASTTIYRHIFSSGTSESVVNVKDYVENANIVYNNLGVHPITGEVYFNTIKAYGWDFLINNISVFNLGQSDPKLTINYKDHTHFPAGIFFTYNFE
ncbi:DUF5074 domain-containing protein [Dysgonomonas sp. 511]|uniref:DUF5074 domain-containing protein n=1 Tax=Dysgonomonas sp. 511 TaxID=2302930 RepID=UPI0013CFF3F0|nr:DUF5074 domain-containing protein [Dysgonomonas sp. 511]NDV78967.1 DUF5074 domain-containing protein [Dysgonomonas sp. 511]